MSGGLHTVPTLLLRISMVAARGGVATAGDFFCQMMGVDIL